MIYCFKFCFQILLASLQPGALILTPLVIRSPPPPPPPHSSLSVAPPLPLPPVTPDMRPARDGGGEATTSVADVVSALTGSGGGGVGGGGPGVGACGGGGGGWGGWGRLEPFRTVETDEAGRAEAAAAAAAAESSNVGRVTGGPMSLGAALVVAAAAAPTGVHRWEGWFGDGPGRAVQVEPIKPRLEAPGTKRLILKCDDLLSSFAFKFNLCRYTQERPN